MRLTPRARANRENSKKSRGPTSAEGKLRSSRNAFRHGLATPVLSRPGASQKVSDLAERLADVDAIEARKVELLSRPWLRFVRNPWKAILKFVKEYAEAFHQYDEVDSIAKPTSRDLHKMAKAINFIKTWSNPTFVYEQEIEFSEVAGELKKLERYERRAFSRMIKTLRKLDQAKAECRLEASL